MTRIDCRAISGTGSGESQLITKASDGLVKDGYAILDHVAPVVKLRALHNEFNSRYSGYLRDVEQPDSLKVGGRRFRIPIELMGGFADPDIYGNPTVVAVMRALMGDDAILEAFGAVVSLAGAKAQHVHRDGPFLFEASISPLLPCHAVTFALPLVDMNDEHGTTGLWPGSHRTREQPAGAPPLIPPIPIGSCVLWDFRLFHCGMPNRSSRHRPIIYGTYARSWYRDPTGFTRREQIRLAYPPGFLDGVPAGHRRLFAHVV